MDTQTTDASAADVSASSDALVSGEENSSAANTDTSTSQAADEGTTASADSPENAGNDESKDNAPEENQPDPDNSPITDWSKVELGLTEEDGVDAEVMASFGKAAVDLGLTPKQAKALAKWQLDTIAEARGALMDVGIAELRKDWGRHADANQKKVLGLISQIDRKLGNDSFSKALGTSGATLHAGVCKGLLAISQMLAEDSIGPSGGAAMPAKPETALDGIENAFNEMKAKL